MDVAPGKGLFQRRGNSLVLTFPGRLKVTAPPPTPPGALHWPAFGDWLVTYHSLAISATSWDLQVNNSTTFGSGSFEIRTKVYYRSGVMVETAVGFNPAWNAVPIASYSIANDGVNGPIDHIIFTPGTNQINSGALGQMLFTPGLVGYTDI